MGNYCPEYYAEDAVFPAAGDVESGSGVYGIDGNNSTPTFAVPTEAQVENGVDYGADGTEFTGTLDATTTTPEQVTLLTFTQLTAVAP